jgi:hypothetical protein
MKPGKLVRLITAPFEKRKIIQSKLIGDQLHHLLEGGDVFYEEWMLSSNDYVVTEPDTDNVDSVMIIEGVKYLSSAGYIGLYSQNEAIKKASMFNGKPAKL